MAKAKLSLSVPADVVEKTSSVVREYLRDERNEDHSPEAVKAAVTQWLDRRLDLTLESMPELLTSPASEEALEFSRLLHSIVSPAFNEAEVLHPVFSGERSFSASRLAAMMGYLSSRGIELYKTKLNKLLFYSDLTAYYLTGRGISGSHYVHLPFGPVPNTYENVLTLAEVSGNVSLEPLPNTRSAVRITTGENTSAASEMLNADEKTVIDWVIETYGHLTSAEITEVSHEEMAYKNTRMGEPIAYRYAEFLKQLPPKDLLNQ